MLGKATGRKGVSEETEWVIKELVEELDNWGYRGEAVRMRCDQEPAIEAVRKAVMAIRKGETMPEGSPVGENRPMEE